MREYLKSMRKDQRLSQQAVANALGCYQSYYCAIELGKRQQDMTHSMMEKLATAFKVPVQAIIDAEAAYIAERLESA